MRTVLLATANPAKQAALRRVLADLPVTPTPSSAAPTPDVPEDGATFLENAEAKAAAFARAAGVPAIASDGGMEIPALGAAWNGLRSRRFAGPTDAHRIAALLDLMRGVPPEQRGVRFQEAVALAEPNGRIVAAVQCAGPFGRLAEAPDPRVRPGFWAPALWLYPPRWVLEWDLTDAERAEQRTAWDAVAAALRPALEQWAGV